MSSGGSLGRSVTRNAFALFATLGVFACGAPSPVRLGVVGSAEGVAGARVAVDEINETGGVGGRPLALRAMPDGGAFQASLAIAAADSLSRDGTVIGVVGHSNSSASLSASQIYNASGVVQIAPTSSTPLLTNSGPFTFRMVASDVYQARFLAEQVLGERAKPRVAVLYVNDDYGHALRTELRARLAEANVLPVYETRYAEGVGLPDAAAIARALVNVRPDVLVWIGRASQLRDLAIVLRPVMPRLSILGSDGLDTRLVAVNAEGLFTYVRFVCFVNLRAPTPALEALARRFKAKTGTDLTAEAALSYDAAMLIATAARRVGTDRDAIRRHLASLGRELPAHEGATGRIAFDENGDPKASYCLGHVAAPAAAPATNGIAR